MRIVSHSFPNQICTLYTVIQICNFEFILVYLYHPSILFVAVQWNLYTVVTLGPAVQWNLYTVVTLGPMFYGCNRRGGCITVVTLGPAVQWNLYTVVTLGQCFMAAIEEVAVLQKSSNKLCVPFLIHF